MPNPPIRSLPPRGSTDWGARQFYRLLDDEERIAAERERLLAMSWRATQPKSGNHAHTGNRLSEAARSGAYKGRELVQAMDRARRWPPSTTPISPPIRRVSETGENFDWYKLYCALDPQSCIIGQIFRREDAGSGGSCPEPDCNRVRQECHEECAPLSLGHGSDSPLVYRRCKRECMAAQGCFDF